MNSNKILAATALLAVLGAGLVQAASAEEVKSNSVRLGIYFVGYDVQGTPLAGPFTPPGLRSDLKSVQTAYFGYVRRLSSHFAVEVAAGIPPKTEAVGKGPAMLGSVPFDGQTVLTARWFSPTVLFQYKFFGESSPIRPYIGVGMNYTRFMERRSTPGGDAVSGGPTQVDLSDSTGIAYNAGLEYRLNEHWNMYMSYSKSKVKSDLKATTAGIVRTSHIDFNPSAVVVSLGYSF